MNGARFLYRLASRKFMSGKLGLVRDPSPVLLGIAGFDGRLKFLNSAWEKILGYPPQELVNRPLCELMQQHGHTATVALVDRLLTEDGFDSMEFGLRCQDGTCKWFIWHRRVDSEHQAIFIAGEDITEQKSREIASILRAYEQSRIANPGRYPAAC
jgi:PAS domain S-box-containing protein